MATTPFSGIGLGQLGSEQSYMHGGPINELIGMAPYAALIYGLVKSGAVSKLNGEKWFSDPKKAMGELITGSSPPPATSPDTAPSTAYPSGIFGVPPPQTVATMPVVTNEPTTMATTKSNTTSMNLPSLDDSINHVIPLE